MAARAGIFDPALAPAGIVDPALDKVGVFAIDLIPAPTGGGAFDPALMAAMNRPWPDIVFDRAKVAASGMTPPDVVQP